MARRRDDLGLSWPHDLDVFDVDAWGDNPGENPDKSGPGDVDLRGYRAWMRWTEARMQYAIEFGFSAPDAQHLSVPDGPMPSAVATRPLEMRTR